jgi:hypothetical protein
MYMPPVPIGKKVGAVLVERAVSRAMEEPRNASSAFVHVN